MTTHVRRLTPESHIYRVVYRYADDDTEYAALVTETSEENARQASMAVEPIIIVRVELADWTPST